MQFQSLPGVGGAAGRVDLLLDGHVAVDVEVPGVQVRLHVVVVAGGVVLHDARRVKGLDAAVDPAHPLLRLGLVEPHLPRQVGEQAPRLVEDDPGRDAGVVAVPAEHGGLSSASNCARASSVGSPWKQTMSAKASTPRRSIQ